MSNWFTKMFGWPKKVAAPAPTHVPKTDVFAPRTGESKEARLQRIYSARAPQVTPRMQRQVVAQVPVHREEVRRYETSSDTSNDLALSMLIYSELTRPADPEPSWAPCPSPSYDSGSSSTSSWD